MAENVLRFDYLARDQASPTMGKLAGKFDSLAGKMAKFGKVAATAFLATGVAAIAAGPKVLSYAARLEQMGSKAATVFGGQLGAVEKWGKANAAAMGITSRQAVGLAANFGDLLIPMGFTRKEAAKMSTDVVGLSGALSQWSGGTRSATEVSEILASAMLGERDALKGLGISITEADVAARLAKKGQEDLTGAALAQAKATATQELIFEKSADAQAAYAKGGGTLIAKIDRIKAAFRDYGESLILKVTPALSNLADFTTDTLIPKLRTLSTYITDTLVPKVVAGFKGLKKKIEDALPNIDLSGLGKNLGEQAKGWAGSIIGGVKTGLRTGDWSGLGKTLGESLAKAIGGIGSMTGKLTTAFVKWAAGVNWLHIGEQVGKQALPFIVGLLAGLFDPETIFKSVKQDPGKWAVAILSVIGIGKVGGIIAKGFRAIGLRAPAALFDGLNVATNKLLGWAGHAIGAVVSFIGREFMKGFRAVFPDVGQRFGEWLDLLPTRLGLVALDVRAKAGKMVRGLGDAILKGIGRVVQNIGELIGRMLRPWADAGGWLVRRGAQLVSGLVGGVLSRLGAAASAVGRLISRVTSPFASAGRWLYQAGRELLSGLRDGMFDRVAAAGKWASGIGSRIVGAIKRFFGIRSPSTVFAGIGRNLVAGLVAGLVESNPGAIITRVFGSMPKALGAIVDKGMISIMSLPGRALRALGGLFGGGGGGGNSANRALGQIMARAYGWGSGSQWNALNALVMGESGWNNRAQNPTSTAYGIGQFLNSTWAGVGARKTSDPAGQIAAMLRYISQSYGSPSRAYSLWSRRAPHWYDDGGVMSGPGMIAKRTAAPERVLSPAQTRSFDRLVRVLDRGGNRGGGDVHFHFPNYVGSRDELVRTLSDLNRQGRLGVVLR